MLETSTSRSPWRRISKVGVGGPAGGGHWPIGYVLATRGSSVLAAISAVPPWAIAGATMAHPDHPGTADRGMANGAVRRRRRETRPSDASHRERGCLPRGNRAGAGGDADPDRIASPLRRAGRTRRLPDRPGGRPDLHVRGLHHGTAGGRGVNRSRWDPGRVRGPLLGAAVSRARRPCGSPMAASAIAGGRRDWASSLAPTFAPGWQSWSVRSPAWAILRTWIVLLGFGLPSDPATVCLVLFTMGTVGLLPLGIGNRPCGHGRRTGDRQSRRRHPPRGWWSAPRRCWQS